MPSLQIVRSPRADAEALCARWLVDAVRAGSGRFVALAVGDSTLPLYASIPAAGLKNKRIIPLDELVPAPRDPACAFWKRLRTAVPDGLAVEPLPDDVEALVATDGLSACVLGLGPDGHIAFNQPGSAVDSMTRLVDVSQENLARLGDVEPAERALTIGVGTILSAERVLLVAGGDGKDDALQRVLDGPEGDDVPASFLRRHPACTVLVIES